MIELARLTGRAALCAAAIGVVSAVVAAPASAETTLKFISWQVDESGFAKWWREIIAEYERTHPDVKIEFTKVARNEYADTMTTLFASGAPPEIVHLASFEYQSFAENGWLEDLAPWAERSGLDLSSWAGQEKCVWNGETACIMLLYFGFVMAYNQAILDEAGIAVPETGDEFLAAMRALTVDRNGDGIVDQYGTGHQTVKGNQYLTEMLNYVLDAGAYWTDAEGKPAMDTPEMAAALQRWKTVLDEGLTPMDLPSGDTRQLFIEGKIAMKLDGPWVYGVMRNAAPEVLANLRLAKPPFDPPIGGSSNVIGMPSEISDEKKQLVWEFIELVTSQHFQERFSELGAMPAPRPGAITQAAKDAVSHFDLLIETQQAAARAGVDRIPLGLEVQFNEFAKIVFDEVQRMVIEDLDPADVGRTIQAKALELQ